MRRSLRRLVLRYDNGACLYSPLAISRAGVKDRVADMEWRSRLPLVTAEHGAAKVEADTYVITDGGKVVTIHTGTETMVFHNTTAP